MGSETLIMQPEKLDLGDAIQNLADNLQALRDFEQLVGSLLTDRHKNIFKDREDEAALLALLMHVSRPEKAPLPSEVYEQLKKKLGVTVETVQEGEEVRVTINNLEERKGKALTALIRDFSKSTKHQALLYRSALITLVSAAEWFLAQIIRGYLETHPGASGTKDKTLSLEDLKKLGSIEDATKFLIELKVDEIMRGSFEDWLEYLMSYVKLSAGYLKPYREELVEVFQRRNVMVHNNGIVHSSYVYKVAEKHRAGLKLGDRIDVTPEYLSRAIDIVESNFILLGAELWKQLSPGDEDRANCLIDIAFSRLTASNWLVAGALSYFTQADRNLSEQVQLVGMINHWQSKKWSGEFETVEKQVRDADFTAKDELYQAVRHVLLDEFEDFFELLPSLVKSEKLNYEKLSTWPVFREVRSRVEFHEVMESAREKEQPGTTALELNRENRADSECS